MEHDPRKFHFVVKTPLSTNLSRSQGQARFELFRHAKLKPARCSESWQTRALPRGTNATFSLTHPATTDDNWEDVSTTGTLESTVDMRHRNRREPGATRHSRNCITSRAPVLTYLEGSSDPFGAQSIVITPQINRLISFIRDSYIPALYVTPFMRSFSQECPKYTTIENIEVALGGTCAVKNWHHLGSSLSGDGGASAWVAGWVPCILPFVDKSELREWHLTGLKMRAHSLQALRKVLSEGVDCRQVGSPVLIHVLYLFRADCVMGDTYAATVHARMLRPLIEAMEDPYHQAELLVIALYNDCELQIAKMERTMFDVYNWVPNRLANFWKKTEVLLPNVGEEYKDLHGSIKTTRIREVAIHLRRCLLIGRTPMKLSDPLTKKLGEAVYNWMATITLCDMGTLVAAHLDLIEGKTDLLSEGTRFTEAALALALLQILRKSMHSMTVDSIADRRDYSHIIIPRLRSTLEKAHGSATSEELSQYEEAYLWMYFIGTHYEQRLRKKPNTETSSDTEEQWFSDKFIEQSCLLGFSTWSEIESVLKMFVVNPYLYLGQSLETWFHDTIDKVDNQSIAQTQC